MPDTLIGGFNNKHYDDWILRTILAGGDNATVKACNDWIIAEHRQGWEFPFLRGSEPLPCKTFDLRDDIVDKGLSLKAIEGNLCMPIIESSVPFDLDRALTPEELEETIYYCKHDVDSTIELYKARKEDYIDAKAMVGEMYGVPPEEAVGLTNAKLSARVLEAVKQDHDDERDYVMPDNIDRGKIPDVVYEFFDQIHDKSIPDIKLFGDPKGTPKVDGTKLEVILKTGGGECPMTYAWGGVHGAKPRVTVEETADRVIINQDVSSLYPNSMINFGYCSRAMPDPDAYAKLVKRRIGYKHAGDTARAKSLKLVVNTVYGAMLNKYNPLADRRAGRSVCITNQLAMTMLIVTLAEQCGSIDFININTDGIMFTIDRNEVDLSEQIVKEWTEVTGLEMERDDFVKVIQKDVNNYIGIESNGKFKTKGGFVSVYKSGSFKSNSLQIIDRAVVDYLVKGIPVERTIRECTDIFAFQQIVKTGSTYESCYHYIDGERVPIQRVNRIYAVTSQKYGKLVKGKWIREKRKKNKETGKMETITIDPPIWQESDVANCPEHARIDNNNEMTVADLDLDYYIKQAKKRVDKYIKPDRLIERKISKIDKEIKIMATTKTTPTPTMTNIYDKLTEARRRFLAAGIKKNGVNTYAEYTYFTLDDIIPEKQKIFADLKMIDVISFGTEVATLTLVNAENPDEQIEFMSQLAPDESMIKNPIQKVGAIQTYVRRYLYMLALDIIESDGIEETTGKKEETKPVTTRKSKPVTPAERAETKKELTDADGDAPATMKKAITNGLKKLRARYVNSDKEITDQALHDTYEPFVKECVKRVKAGISKNEAEALLIEIGNKIEEA